jgi:hypothetical protein
MPSKSANLTRGLAQGWSGPSKRRFGEGERANSRHFPPFRDIDSLLVKKI